jgi:hypothetical protein
MDGNPRLMLPSSTLMHANGAANCKFLVAAGAILRHRVALCEYPEQAPGVKWQELKPKRGCPR